MAKFRKTIFLSDRDTSLFKRGRVIEVRRKGELLAKIPIDEISDILVFTDAYLSPELAHSLTATTYEQPIFAAGKKIGSSNPQNKKSCSIHYLNKYGHFLGSFEGGFSRSVGARHKQHIKFENKTECLKLAKNIIISKILNQMQNINYHKYQYSKEIGDGKLNLLKEAEKKLLGSIKRVYTCESTEELLGVEGDAARTYWSVFGLLIRNKKFQFNDRTKHPPLDAVNALLSLLYTTLTSRCAGALASTGLDAHYGFYHKPQGGRPSLACDMVEEFRGDAERLILKIINKRQLNQDDFEHDDGGGVYLKAKSRKKFFSYVEEWLKEPVYSPWWEKEIERHYLFFTQADFLLRYLNDDIDTYVPYFKA